MQHMTSPISSFEYDKLYTKVGIEFEFKRNKDYNRGVIKTELQKLFGVKIQLEQGSHSDFKPTAEHWKIEEDFSLGDFSCELVTGPLDYSVARIQIMKMLNWLRTNPNVYTTDRCGIHLNLNYPDKPYIANIDILKFILLFDEEEVYTRFPLRRNNLYTKSIKEVVPIHSNFDFKNLSTNRKNFLYPNTKYYGVNFDKLNKGYLEFRYIGGKNYQNQQSDILYLLDYFLKSLKTGFESDDTKLKYKLSEILSKKKHIFLAGQSYFNFKNVFKNIKITIDNKDNEEVIKTFFNKVWQMLFPVFIKSLELKQSSYGVINYDSDNACLEISEMNIKHTEINSNNIILYKCKISSLVAKGVPIYDCVIINSDFDNCEVFDSSLKNSRIKNNDIHYSELDGCYLDGVTVFDSEITRGVFRKGKYSNTKIDSSAIVIHDDVQDLDKQN